MLVLIDESGDAGFKLEEGSSSHLVLAMVIFRDLAEAERTSACIKRAQARLRVKPEFKFTRCCDDVRTEFFETIRECGISVRALVVDKAAIRSNHLRCQKEAFYSYFVRLLLHHDNGALTGARVKIDGSGDRVFKRELNAYLRRQISAEKVASVKLADSRKDSLVQLADMCAGAIFRARRSDDKRNGEWYEQLRAARLIEDIWDFR